MASYAAVMTLTDLMDPIQRYHSLHHIFTDHQQIQLQFLREKCSVIQRFLETSNYIYSNFNVDSSDGVRVFESRISDADYLAADIIETYIVEYVLARSNNELEKLNPSKFNQDVEKVIGDFKSLKSKVLENPLPQETKASGSARVLYTAKDFLVGFDGILTQVTNKLTGYASDRQVIALTGMGGIRKSTLAKKLYDDQRSRQRFDVCAWVTGSKVFTIQDLLIQLLKECGVQQNGEEKYVNEMGIILHKYLIGRRYFIGIDDIWSLDAWDGIKLFHFEDNNRNQIIVTTRLLHLSSDIGSCHIYKVNLLDEDESWSLLIREVLSKKVVPVNWRNFEK